MFRAWQSLELAFFPRVMHYLVSGLHLKTNQALAQLQPQTVSSRVDVEIGLDESPPELDRVPAAQQLWYSSVQVDGQGHPSLKIFSLADGAYFRLVFVDGSEFVVDRNGVRVWGTWSSVVPADERTSFLLGLVLSFVLCLRGIPCLHASAVSVGNETIAFVGPEGAGKSTIAAAFAMHGFPVVADDLVALTSTDETFLAQPGYPWLRLRPSAKNALTNKKIELPILWPTEDGLYLDLDLTQTGYSFERRALPLAALYFCGPTGDDVPGALIDSMPDNSGLMALVANTWATRVLNRSMRAREFETLSKLSAQVPLRRVRPATSRFSAPELSEAILDDFHRIPSRPAMATSL